MSNADDLQVEHSTVTADNNVVHQTLIKDTKSNRAWSGEGDTQNKASTEATRKMISDRRSREYQ
jgi:hypothetical protein